MLPKVRTRCVGSLWRFGVGVLGLLLTLCVAPSAYALDDCTASVDTHSVSPSTRVTFSFTVVNNGPEDALWIKVTRPSSNFLLVAYEAANWTLDTLTEEEVALTGGTLSMSEGNTVSIIADIESAAASSADWIVELAPTAWGSDSAYCTGSLGTAIVSLTGTPTPAPTATPTPVPADTVSPQVVLQVPSSASYKVSPTITGRAVDDKGITSVQFSTDNGVTWRGPVENVTTGATSTPLSFKPASLKDGKYTVRARATDAAGNVGVSASFLLTIDQNGPKITVYNAPNTPVAEAPVLSGILADASGFQTLSYSTDDGVNWTEVPIQYAIGSVQLPFTIDTGLRDDGNYRIHIRATDTLGNTGSDTVISLVVDRLPPIVGGNLFRMGSFILTPDQDGSVTVPAGVPVHLVLSAVGGATSITLTGQNATDNLFDAPLDMSQIPDSTLWWTEFQAPRAGTYTIDAHAIDGALNTTDRTIATIISSRQGLVLGNTEPISGATTTVYVFDRTLGRFILWDGAAFGQTNPQTTDTSGRYAYFLPAGKYFIAVRARGFRPFTSAIFELSKEQSVSSPVTLMPGWRLCLGSWCLPIPDLRETTGSVTETNTEISSAEASTNPFIGNQLPEFLLEGAEGDITPLTLRGKDTILTLLNTWWPQTATQLTVLDAIEKQGHWHSVVLFPEESRSFIASYRKRGNYLVPLTADPDGSLINIFQYKTIPMHILINQQGVVLNVLYGLLYPENIVDNGGG